MRPCAEESSKLKDTNLWLDEELGELVDRHIEESLCVDSVKNSDKEIDMSGVAKERKQINKLLLMCRVEMRSDMTLELGHQKWCALGALYDNKFKSI
jgi:hypothetical protein